MLCEDGIVEWCIYKMRNAREGLANQQEPGRGEEDSPPEVSDGARPHPTLDFGRLDSRTVRQYVSGVLNCPVCCYNSPRKLIYLSFPDV